MGFNQYTCEECNEVNKRLVDVESNVYKMIDVIERILEENIKLKSKVEWLEETIRYKY